MGSSKVISSHVEYTVTNKLQAENNQEFGKMSDQSMQENQMKDKNGVEYCFFQGYALVRRNVVTRQEKSLKDE
jgi:hypothetical protein